MANSGIAFTLPISCQICLGKVKQPVVCPNQHVFCSPCMDVWLQRSQHCPACRTPIDDDNPCRLILGGLSQENDTKEDFSKNRELRRARVDVLFKEYEEEFERLQNEMETIKNENKVLAEQLKHFRHLQTGDSTVPPPKDGRPDHPDVETLLNLTKKLQETMASHDKLKKERDRVKKENNYLKDENVNLGRENQQLRMEMTSRSPRKYGRLAAVAMEAKMESYEKENKLLQKALERSDLYVEGIEEELEKHRKFVKTFSKCPNCDAELKLRDAISNVDEVETGEHFSKFSSKPGILQRASTWPSSQDGDKSDQGKSVISGNSFYGKKPTPVKVKPTNSPVRTTNRINANRLDAKTILGSSITPKKGDDSFGLEQPSPITPSTGLRRLALNDGGPDCIGSDSSALAGDGASSTFENMDALPSTSDNSLTESCRKKLRFDAGKEEDVFSRPSTSGFQSDSRDSTLQSRANADESWASSTLSAKQSEDRSKSRKPKREDTFEMPSSTWESDEQDDADHNMTNDIAECLELLDAAERKVSQQKFKAPLPPQHISSSSASFRSHIQDSKWKTSIGNKMNGNAPYGNDARLKNPYDQVRPQPSSSITDSNLSFAKSSSGLVPVHSVQLPSWYKEMEGVPSSGYAGVYNSAPVSSKCSMTIPGDASNLRSNRVTSADVTAIPRISSSSANSRPNVTNLPSYEQTIRDMKPETLSHFANKSTTANGRFVSSGLVSSGLPASLSQSSVSSGFASRDFNSSNPHGYILSQPGFSMSQPGYTLSQPGNTLSQPISTTSYVFTDSLNK